MHGSASGIKGDYIKDIRGYMKRGEACIIILGGAK